MSTKVFSGGGVLISKLQQIAQKIKSESTLNVGFLAGSTEEKSNIPTASVAYINEFGGTVPERKVSEHVSQIYRRVNKKGNLLNGGKFTKKSKSNLTTDVIIPEHIIPEHKIPARPFFRNMIAAGSKHWGKDLAKHLKRNDLDMTQAAKDMGEQMASELKKSILAKGYAPLAKSTIEKKGHSQTLVDTSDMINSVNFEIE